MKKLKVTKNQAIAIDWACCFISLGLCISVDWRLGMAFIFYEIMRAFESLQEKNN